MNLLRGLIVVGAILALPFTGYAQEAVVSGTVTDTTGGVLPGVTMTARQAATGNTFVAVTDERGVYRLDVRIGTYELTAELQGFATIVRGGLALLVGQQVVANLQLAPAGLQESVTVTGEAPLIDVTSSTVGGNIDPRQMQELPLAGRSWQDLTMLAPGNRRNESGDSPTLRNRRDFHINLDGQQTTSILVQGGGTGTGAADQPLYSKDAIAEFQFVSSRFNATQGRSIGTQVNAVTKSGTNTPSGSFGGYFRHDRFIAADFVTGTVLPYRNQQLSGTLGGPIVRDKLHFFGNYEYEREPGTIVYTTPYPSFNMTLPNIRKQKMAGTRVDWQMSSRTRLMARGNYGLEVIPNEGGGANHPSGATEFRRHNDEIFTTLTQVLGDRSLNELKGGFASFYYYNYSVVNWPEHPMAASQGVTIGTPRVLFTGFTVGPAANNPQRLGQTVWSIRDDFTHSFNARGRHDLKVGGEYLYLDGYTSNCRGCQGQYTVTGGPVPANIEAIFPVWNDVSTWKMDLLSPIITRYDVTVGTLQTYQTRNTFGGWFQDDWAIASRMTLNLGIRYDLGLGQLANDIVIEPFLPPGRPEDLNNFGPRAGLNYSLNDRTVLRGGYGLFFGEIANTMTSRTQSWTQLTGATVENTAPRRANFGSSPFNGPIPTYAQAQERYCHKNNVPGCLREGLEQLVDPYGKVMYSHQASAGFQRQIGSTMAVEADYTYEGERGGFYSHRSNLTYDPVTGVNYPFSDISRRAYPLYAAIGIERLARRSNIHVLQSAWTKRFSNRWSATGTYTLAGYWDAQAPPLSGIDQVTFPVAPDLGGEYSLSEGDQRHRAVLSGIWDAGYGFQLSGLYFFGSGQRRATDWGGDLRQTGVAAQGGRLRPNGTVVPRNNFVGDPLHRVDIRLQRRFRFGSAAGIDGMLEVFNLFNHTNFGSYVTSESNRLYGQATVNSNVAYQPRTLQLGFRATF